MHNKNAHYTYMHNISIAKSRYDLGSSVVLSGGLGPLQRHSRGVAIEVLGRLIRPITLITPWVSLQRRQFATPNAVMPATPSIL